MTNIYCGYNYCTIQPYENTYKAFVGYNLDLAIFISLRRCIYQLIAELLMHGPFYAGLPHVP